MKIYFDGGCKPNPGKMEIAVVSECGSVRFHQRIHDGTNNEAEWIAFLAAVELADHYKDQDITILGDSNLVIQQALGKWKVNAPELKTYKACFDQVKARLPRLTLLHVRRNDNLAGQYIEDLN
jgi:ribonuclease HI